MDPYTALQIIRMIYVIIAEIHKQKEKQKNHRRLVAKFAEEVEETEKTMRKFEDSLLSLQELGLSSNIKQLNELKRLLEESAKLLKMLADERPRKILGVRVPTRTSATKKRVKELRDKIHDIRLRIAEATILDIYQSTRSRVVRVPHSRLSLQVKLGDLADINVRFIKGPSRIRSFYVGAGSSTGNWGIYANIPYRVSWRKK